MFTKRLLATLTALAVTMGLGANCGISPTSSSEKAQPAETPLVLSNYMYGGPRDLSIANEEKVIEMLKKEGKIPKNASAEEVKKIYNEYLRKCDEQNKNKPVAKLERSRNVDKKAGVKEKSSAPKAEANERDKITQKKILVLLIDYPDLRTGNITDKETDMYYHEYTRQHYQDMLFGDNGMKGPNGENLISMKQFYDQQSGGTFKVSGTVSKWYTAEHDAAYYGGNEENGDDSNPRALIKEALNQAAKDPEINLKDFDLDDPYDLDEDGNINEPDGIIDNVMVIHAGVGEEAGGGNIGTNAIWSHSWDLAGLYKIPGTEMGAFKYTIEPEDGATGVFAHEFGHAAGVPDEYDTKYTGDGEAIGYWSIMAGGSWGGKIGGTEPSAFSPYSRQKFQKLYGGKWQIANVLESKDINAAGKTINLKQASDAGDVVRVNLPKKKVEMTKPQSGKYLYWSGMGDADNPANNSMLATIDLKGKTSAELNFKTMYDIEKNWDFASLWAREKGATDWTCLEGNITAKEDNPDADVQVPCGITGKSNGWVDAKFDLSKFAGKEMELAIAYQTDSAVFGMGFFMDNIVVKADDAVVLEDNADGEPKFALNGFSKNDGIREIDNYYLVEWRNYAGVDAGLKNARRGAMPYDPGMLIWYADETYSDNWTGKHPGEGYLGIVDADQKGLKWTWNNTGEVAYNGSSSWQMHDAAFSLKKSSTFKYSDEDPATGQLRTIEDTYAAPKPMFDDSRNYSSPDCPDTGRNIPKCGLKIYITGENKGRTGATIKIKK